MDGPDRLDRVIDEAMRVTTPTPVMLRSVAAPALIGGNGEIGPVAGRGTPAWRCVRVTGC
nr:hypothetical protein GCM10020093_074580 [Planobispora longispora]